jgi:monoamine oxidase
LLDFARAQAKVEALARTVPLGKPWEAPRADAYDAQTVAAWLKENTATAGARSLFDLVLEGTLGKADEVSLLYFLFYLHSAGGLDALESTEGGAQDSRFVGGSQLVSLRLAAQLKDRVILKAPVLRVVDRPPERVRVVTATTVFEARRVVVAMMPADTRRIAFDPPLPAARQGLVKGWKGSPAFKVNVVYDKPFWREDGLNGQATGELPLVGMTFDNSPPGGRPGVLVAFLNETAAARLRIAEQRRQAVLQDLAKYFGDSARRPTGYVEMDWGAEKWTSGCVSPVGPRLLTRFGPALRDPVGRFTGPVRRLPTCGRATWKAPCAPASAWPRRSERP